MLILRFGSVDAVCMKTQGFCLLLLAQFACSPIAIGHTGEGPRREAASVGEVTVPEGRVVVSASEPGKARHAAAQDHRREADLFVRSGLVSEAIPHYLRAIELDPLDGGQYFKLGLAYQALRQFDHALFSYGQAVRLEPGSVWAHAALAIVHAKVGNPEAAFASYRDVKALDRETARGLLPVLLQYGKGDDV